MRVDDEVSVLADRNWPSGVLRVQSRSVPATAGERASQGITLLQVHAAATTSADSCASSAGHVEPLLPASSVFRRCAGVSHPLYTGRPAAWMPFLPHRAEKRFATLYYDGLINVDLGSAAWMRPAAGGSALHSTDPFSSGCSRAVIRAGSVVKFRVEQPVDPDSQATETEEPEGEQMEAQGVVLLTYVHVSDEYTQKWLQLCRDSFSPQEQQQLEHFCALFPATPMAKFAVQQLDDVELGKEFHAAVSVCDIVEVLPPDSSNLLWTQTRTTPMQHLIVKPKPKLAAKSKGAQLRVQPPIVLEPVCVEQPRYALLHRMLEEQYTNPSSSFCRWFADEQTETRGRPSQLPSLHSFYHDITHDAALGFDSERMNCLMAVRRILNVPQPQPQRSEEASEPPRSAAPAVAAAPAKPAPAATGSAPVPSAGRSSRRAPVTSPTVSGATPAADPAATTGRSRTPTLPAKVRAEVADRLVAILEQLSDIHASERNAPFAALLEGHMTASARKSLTQNIRIRNGLKNCQNKALTTVRLHSPTLEVLQTAAEQSLAQPASAKSRGSSSKVQEALTATELESVCRQLVERSAGAALCWLATNGIRPDMNACSLAQRMQMSTEQPQPQPQPQPHQHPMAHQLATVPPLVPRFAVSAGRAQGPKMLAVAKYAAHGQASAGLNAEAQQMQEHIKQQLKQQSEVTQALNNGLAILQA